MCFLLACFFVVPAINAQAQTLTVSPEQIDQLATKSDRWLFIAALVLLLGFGGMVMKWLIAQLDKQREANVKAQEQQILYLTGVNMQMNSSMQSNTAMLAATNTMNEKVLAVCTRIEVDLNRDWERLEKHYEQSPIKAG